MAGTSVREIALFPLPPGLVAITGDEGAGKTSALRRLAGALPALPGQPPGLDALWLDLSLPEQGEQTPQQVWDGLRPRCPRWNPALQQDLVAALGLLPHHDKKLFMLSTGS
ncbi:MAG TPA: hypothetical protein VFE74_07715, partial [Ramlibacter sp.]|nr:hypothetical protein [Ramlibacter sp.]